MRTRDTDPNADEVDEVLSAFDQEFEDLFTRQMQIVNYVESGNRDGYLDTPSDASAASPHDVPLQLDIDSDQSLQQLAGGGTVRVVGTAFLSQRHDGALEPDVDVVKRTLRDPRDGREYAIEHIERQPDNTLKLWVTDELSEPT